MQKSRGIFLPECDKSFEAYQQVKARYPKHLLFRVEGGRAVSYAMDAKMLEEKLGLPSYWSQTARGRVQCVAIDVAALQQRLAQLLRMGISVAVCDPEKKSDAPLAPGARSLVDRIADAFVELDVFLDGLDSLGASARAGAIQKVIDAAAGDDGGREERRVRGVLDLLHDERAKIRKCKHDYRRLGTGMVGLCCRCGDQTEHLVLSKV